MSLVGSTYKKLMFAHQALAGSKLLELFAGLSSKEKKKHRSGVSFCVETSLSCFLKFVMLFFNYLLYLKNE